jgi:hypothetical protein
VKKKKGDGMERDSRGSLEIIFETEFEIEFAVFFADSA